MGDLDLITDMAFFVSFLSTYPFSLAHAPPFHICSQPYPSVLVAELIKFYFPKMVEMHNYVPANSLQQKLNNWGHLNR